MSEALRAPFDRVGRDRLSNMKAQSSTTSLLHIPSGKPLRRLIKERCR